MNQHEKAAERTRELVRIARDLEKWIRETPPRTVMSTTGGIESGDGAGDRRGRREALEEQKPMNSTPIRECRSSDAEIWIEGIPYERCLEFEAEMFIRW